mmetsp:Transcript_6142/g.9263  ORF Transcript_6142/g.9263 Transcript_6142/m.9263 type:complete len:226 (+) Transcript_6142:41-718(+)
MSEPNELEATPDPSLPDSEAIVKSLNEDKVFMLMLSWAVIGCPEAVSARALAIDKTQIEMEIETAHWRTGEKSVVRKSHEFMEPISDPNDVDKTLKSLRTYASLAVWPPGPAGYISLFLWLICITGLVSAEKQGSVYFNMIRTVSSYIFPSPYYAYIGLALVAGSHALEALYIWFSLAPLNLPFAGRVSYASMSFILGFPSTKHAMFLKAFWSKENNREESKKSK